VDDYCLESNGFTIPSALDFVSEDEMLTPLERLDKNASSEDVFNRQVTMKETVLLL
jgi:serine/threonine-protein phosphatase 4 regulatory subunit 1